MRIRTFAVALLAGATPVPTVPDMPVPTTLPV